MPNGWGIFEFEPGPNANDVITAFIIFSSGPLMRMMSHFYLAGLE